MLQYEVLLLLIPSDLKQGCLGLQIWSFWLFKSSFLLIYIVHFIIRMSNIKPEVLWIFLKRLIPLKEIGLCQLPF